MAVERVRREAEAVLAAMIGSVDASMSYTDDGHRSTANWWRAVTNCSHPAAARMVRQARTIRDLPAVGDALADGHVGSCQVDELARLHHNDQAAPHLADAIDLMLEHASLLPFDDFRQVCRRFNQFADPHGSHRDHEASRRNRHIGVQPDGAGFRLHAAGDALSGDVFERTLDRYAQLEFDRDWAEGVTVHGDRMCPALLARTNRQRRFDAFIALSHAADDVLDHPSGRGPAQRRSGPIVNIHCDEQTALDAIRLLDSCHAPATVVRGAVVHAAVVGRRSETTSGAPVDPHDLLIALLTGSVRAVVHDSTGRVVDLGRRRRLFTGAAREAAMLSGGHCTFPGCTIRDVQLHVDHTIAWARGGPTDQRNANIRCGHHNVLKDLLGQATRPDSHHPGTWITYRIDGSVIAPRTSPRTARGGRPPPASHVGG